MNAALSLALVLSLLGAYALRPTGPGPAGTAGGIHETSSKDKDPGPTPAEDRPDPPKPPAPPRPPKPPKPPKSPTPKPNKPESPTPRPPGPPESPSPTPAQAYTPAPATPSADGTSDDN